MISFIDDNGVERFLGNLVPTRAVNEILQAPIYGDTSECPMLARSEWPGNCRTSLEDAFLPPVHDQDGIGMCNASATAAAIEAARATQGLPYVALSGGDLYGRINGGSDRGSMLEDGIRAATTKGVAPVSACPYLDWRRRAVTDDQRAPYRVLKAYLCPTFDHMFSASIAGFELIVGLMWGNFKTDSDGWLTGGGGGSGHALYSYAPMMRNGKYGLATQNSWTPNWGVNGRCVIPESFFGSAIGGWWAVGSVVDEGGVIPTH
jgi:hypothetical protein